MSHVIELLQAAEESHQPVYPSSLTKVYIACQNNGQCPRTSSEQTAPVSEQKRLRSEYIDVIVLGFNDTSTLVGHFVSSPREREKRDRRDSRGDEREGQGRKRNRNENEETE